MLAKSELAIIEDPGVKEVLILFERFAGRKATPEEVQEVVDEYAKMKKGKENA